MINLDHIKEETIAQHEQHFRELRETIKHGWRLIKESRETIEKGTRYSKTGNRGLRWIRRLKQSGWKPCVVVSMPRENLS